MNRVPFYGATVACIDSPGVRALLPRMRKPVWTYGESLEADYTARGMRVRGGTTSFEVWRGEQQLGPVTLQMPGRHHGLNALAALIVATELEIPFEVGVDALARFGGIHRRFELLGEVGGVMIVDDYGHHPAEIMATIRAAREGFERRLVVVFQPHRFSRTRDLFQEFVGAFDAADLLVLTEIYPAGERAIPGATGESLYRELVGRGRTPVHFVPERATVARAVRELLSPGDLVLVLGAGDIARCAHDLMALLADGGAEATRPV
jgi:UDP-N-acetylmuramate--alanine ligase